MLTVHIEEVQTIYECQPLLSPGDFPLPGSGDSDCDEEENDGGS